MFYLSHLGLQILELRKLLHQTIIWVKILHTHYNEFHQKIFKILAVRNTSGFYYLNGNWRINFPRTLEFAGSKFHYERYPQGFLAPDKISCLGPTDEALFIVVCNIHVIPQHLLTPSSFAASISRHKRRNTLRI